MRGHPRALVLASLLSIPLTGCATAGLPPPPDAAARAQATLSYSGRLRVSLRAPEFRARSAALVAFRRPDALRIEIPGPGGARLVAVTRQGTLVAVFPGERAFFQASATPAELDALLGVPLAPDEVIDLLLGVGSPRLRQYETRWGPDLPRTVEATLPDGGRLKVTVEEADRNVELAAAAFDDPPHDGYRALDAEEARAIWTGR
jgi:outer membrane lipoprotein-sorting protein